VHSYCDVDVQEMLDAGTSGEIATTFKSLHSAAAQVESAHPGCSDVSSYVGSVSPDFHFVASDFRRMLPRDRVNLVGSVFVGGAGPAGAGEGGVEATGSSANLLSVVAWDELRERLKAAEREKADMECRAAAESNHLRRKLAESERRRHELKKQLKRTVPASST